MFQKIGFLLLSNYFRGKSFGIFLLSLCFLWQINFGQETPKKNSPELVALELNQPIEGELAANEKRSYQITLAENQYVLVTVEQRGIDVVVRVFNQTDERAMVQRDLISKTDGSEKINFVAAKAGVYRLEIEAKMPPPVTGNYTVRLAEVRSPTAKELRLEEARRLHNESFLLWKAGKFAEAMPIAERSLEIRENELGAEDLDVAASFANLALILNETGDYAKAISLLERSLKIREKILGPDHLDLAIALNNLSSDYLILGDYEKAEQLLRRTLAIREKNLPPNNPYIANSLASLANVYLYRGDLDKSLELGLRAISIREKTPGFDQPNLALDLAIVGNAYVEKGDYQSAETYYLRALSISQKIFGAEHPRTAERLGSLANLYVKQGRYAQAEPLFEQALAGIAKTLGKEHRNYALALYYLAVLYTDTGEYQKAAPLYQEAIAISEKLFGSQHPFVILYLNDLGRNYQAQGETAKALEVWTRAHKLKEQIIQLVLSTASEQEKLLYLNKLFGETNQHISAHLEFAPDNPAALELALTTIFERKGRVADAVASEFAALRNRFDKDDQILLDKLQETNSRLAQKILNPQANIKPDEYQKQIKELEAQKEQLEIEISRRSAEFRSKIQPVTIASIRAAIPEDAALVEFSIYYPFDPKVPDSKAYGAPRYVAYVVRRGGKIQWKDLGAAKAIDDSIKNFRQALSDPKRKDVQQFARATDELLMQPIRGLTGDATHLLISPDGALNLIPFEALADEKGKYLIENYSFTYLTGGRDLLRMQTARASKNKSLIIANPSFGEQIAQVKSNERGKKRQSITATRDLSDTYFAPLDNTTQEARAIQTLFPEATVLTGTAATKTALEQIDAPRILHIATHGFFLENADELKFDTSAENRRVISNIESKNPLLRSGLALAGANRRDGKNDDGILTALEASGLNLWGTKLVVLSACDTGIGDVKNGEGVYGLRRAFVLAGTESLVMSLWSVSDYATRELMSGYYKNLKNGIGRGASLHQIQLELMKKKGREHPFYWAGFIQSGEWANLDGKRL